MNVTLDNSRYIFACCLLTKHLYEGNVPRRYRTGVTRLWGAAMRQPEFDMDDAKEMLSKLLPRIPDATQWNWDTDLHMPYVPHGAGDPEEWVYPCGLLMKELVNGNVPRRCQTMVLRLWGTALRSNGILAHEILGTVLSPPFPEEVTDEAFQQTWSACKHALFHPRE